MDSLLLQRHRSAIELEIARDQTRKLRKLRVIYAIDKRRIKSERMTDPSRDSPKEEGKQRVTETREEAGYRKVQINFAQRGRNEISTRTEFYGRVT